MSRKGPTKIRNLEPDPVYHSLIVARLINAAMRHGKKEPARGQVYQALELFQKEIPAKTDLLTVLEQSLDNIKPRVEVRPRRIGGAVYQVPTPVRGHRQNSLALRWLIDVSRAKPNKQFHSFAQKLSSELILALKNEGSAVAKKAEVERMAEANKAFAHLRW
ncbi:30S ribosomal protein S7 [Candidatus Shapirobacteria bacterium RBG_13_44_7]|uniref:Small ribosomal subunit protein uS7 n=1 Tax=Candidatus Shapirobacteria bacterium RBG_13_44_7 TaxID=1802149 RepID=A0A1F7SIE0_9BACT|nr:MAG: 30S ribosomal protein S7 [Candidatus Shapirobacteria bacterium RBG_13_44_7]